MNSQNIKTSLEAWERVCAAIEEELLERGFTNKFTASLMLALDEVIANIVSYAYEGEEGSLIVKTEYSEDKGIRTAAVSFTDFGREFNPLEYKAEKSDGTADGERKVGGWGIFLIKKQVDSLKYERINSSNILTLIKKETI